MGKSKASQAGWTDYALLQSSGDSSKQWKVQINVDGEWRCYCPAYIFCKASPRTCKHIRICQAEVAALQKEPGKTVTVGAIPASSADVAAWHKKVTQNPKPFLTLPAAKSFQIPLTKWQQKAVDDALQQKTVTPPKIDPSLAQAQAIVTKMLLASDLHALAGAYQVKRMVETLARELERLQTTAKPKPKTEAPVDHIENNGLRIITFDDD